jgi:drug/metabolite transporter (DMT)-like permease
MNGYKDFLKSFFQNTYRLFSSENFAVQGFLWAMSANISFVAVMILNKAFKAYLPVTLIVWGRCLFALALIVPFLQWKNMRQLWGVQLMRGGVVAGAMLCSYTAYRHLPVHIAALIGASSTLFTMILANILLQEKVDQKRWIGAIVGYAGVAILVHDVLSEAWTISVAWAVLGNFLAAMSGILSRWLVLRSTNPQAILAYGMVIPFTLFSLVVVLDSNLSLAHLTPLQWYILALLGSIGALIQYATLRAYKVAKASFVAPLEYTRLCLMIPAGYIFLGEVPSLWSYVGGLLIVLVSIFFVVWEVKKV